jgi:very-short-patch-repair endonuclease
MASASVPVNEELRAPLAEARKDLLDFGLRNPLLNYRLLKARGLEIPGMAPAEVFRALVVEGAELSFLGVEEMLRIGASLVLDGKAKDTSRSLVRTGQGRKRQTEEPAEDWLRQKELPTGIPEKELEKRLLATYYAAKSSIEEQGVNTLFIALGMLMWRDPRDTEIHRAPLLLVPVELERRSAGEGFRLKYSGEDVSPNVCLLEYLKQSVGIELDDLMDSEEIDVGNYFYSVGQSVSKQDGWSVDPESIALGFFSFAKLLMYRDLDPATWENEALLLNHSVLNRLLGANTFSGDASPFSDHSFIDDHISVSDATHVMDADSTQSLAILDVARGLNMVIQGPPGTGKSQTIVNLIAGALASGKKVLFVAEKKAALEVVKRRLDRIGLGASCLELHSNKVKKKEVINELKQTAWLQPRGGHRNDIDQSVLEDVKTRLNEYCNAVNASAGNSGENIRDLYGILLPLLDRLDGTIRPSLELSGCLNWTSADVHRRREIVARLQERLTGIGIPTQHIFWGSQLRVVLPSTKDAVRNALSQAAVAALVLGNIGKVIAELLEQDPPDSYNGFESLCANAKQIAIAPELNGIDLTAPDWLTQQAKIKSVIATTIHYVDVQSRWAKTILPTAWTTDIAQLETSLNELGHKWWRFISPRWKALQQDIAQLVSTPLSRSTGGVAEILQAIRSASVDRTAMDASDSLLKSLYGANWAGGESDLKLMEQQLEWIISTHQGIQTGNLSAWCIDAAAGFKNQAALRDHLSESEQLVENHAAALKDVIDKLKLDEAADEKLRASVTILWSKEAARAWNDLASRVHELDGLVAYGQDRDLCISEGLQSVAALADSWEEAKQSLLDLFEYVRVSALLDAAFQANPALASFDALRQENNVQTFQQLDARHIESKREALANLHIEGLPRNGADSGQISVLWREFEKKARHLPVRKLILKAGNVIQAIKPVFMMGPLSVATFLPPGTVDFDLVIFDEASQVKPADALGAIARGKQAVVVGDSKQLPPTSFFDTMVAQDAETEEEDAVATSDIESILGLFCSRQAHQRMLRWHYRSKHESLIAGSNHLFYDDRLVVFPSPDRHKEDVGLVYRRVENAHYDRSRTRTNPVEAKAIAEAVIRHAALQLKKTEKHRLTLGVAALSVAQRDAILDQLEILRRQSPDTEEFFLATPHEPFFVKNLENVQGDERDVIFISIGYARTAEGYWSNSFGPVNRAGGERRLNVLFSRARLRCVVFTALHSEDINAESSSALGVYALKTFLTYAEHGYLDVPIATGRPPDSPFEEEVLSTLQRHGYTVHTQVGSAGFFLDLAIVDPTTPGRYLLGIECDGAAYHSARSARDRDRLRQVVLESLGWKIHHIWSTAWFRAPEKELKALEDAIEEAKKQKAQVKISTDRPKIAVKHPSSKVQVAREDPPPLSRTSQSAAKYQLAEISINLGHLELHAVAQEQLANWLTQIIAVESPVHWLEATRRIADAAGIQRVGSRIQSAFQSACNYGHLCKKFENRNGFLWAYEPSQMQVRDRSDFSQQQKKIDLVAPEEICAAIEQTVEQSFGLATEDVAIATCRLLGFARVSEEMRAVVEEQRDNLLNSGKLEYRGETLVLNLNSAL